MSKLGERTHHDLRTVCDDGRTWTRKPRIDAAWRWRVGTADRDRPGYPRGPHRDLSKSKSRAQAVSDGSRDAPDSSTARPIHSDWELIERARRGDEDAFRELVRRHETMVFTLAARRLCNRQLAVEVTQDVFVRLFRHIGSFRFEARLPTWLYRVTQNCCADEERRARRDKRARLQQLGDRAALPPDPETAIASRLDGEFAIFALRELAPEYREVLLLRYLGVQSYREIAEALGIPLGTVMSRIHRGLDRLADLLGSHVEEP